MWSAPRRRRPSRPYGTARRGGAERIRCQQSPHGLLRYLPGLQECGDPGQWRSRPVASSSEFGAVAVKRDTVDLRLSFRFKVAGKEPAREVVGHGERE